MRKQFLTVSTQGFGRRRRDFLENATVTLSYNYRVKPGTLPNFKPFSSLWQRRVSSSAKLPVGKFWMFLFQTQGVFIEKRLNEDLCRLPTYTRGMQHVWRRGEVLIGFWWGTWGKETTWKTQARRKDNIKMCIQGKHNYIDLVCLVSVRYYHMFRLSTSGHSSTTKKRGGRGLFLQTEASPLFTLLVYQCPTDDG
jgi:hypothetical protein